MTQPTDEQFMRAMAVNLDPNWSDIEHLLRLIRCGDVVHINDRPEPQDDEGDTE